MFFLCCAFTMFGLRLPNAPEGRAGGRATTDEGTNHKHTPPRPKWHRAQNARKAPATRRTFDGPYSQMAERSQWRCCGHCSCPSVNLGPLWPCFEKEDCHTTDGRGAPDARGPRPKRATGTNAPATQAKPRRRKHKSRSIGTGNAPPDREDISGCGAVACGGGDTGGNRPGVPYRYQCFAEY